MESDTSWILFYYNSLSEMPSNCQLFSPEVMHRDFFKCNPSNTGHYQYPKFETKSYDDKCHPRELRAFLKRPEENKFVVFYTRHTALSGQGKNKLVGYFKVGRHDGHGFTASEAVLLPKDKCVNIGYTGRGVPASWGRSSVRSQVDKFLNKCRKSRAGDISRKYKAETAKIMKLLTTVPGRRRVLEKCAACAAAGSCFWSRTKKKEQTLQKLYGNPKPC